MRWRLATLAHRLRHDGRGATDVAALIVIVPLAFGAVVLFIYAGRQGTAREAVTHAAAVAARAASMERDAGAAQAAAVAAASRTLAGSGTACAGGPSVAVAASEWAAGGVVTVSVTCQAHGVAEIGAPTRTLSASARATIDNFVLYGG
jgi:Flp pilus assembly protein TadG